MNDETKKPAVKKKVGRRILGKILKILLVAKDIAALIYFAIKILLRKG